MKKITPFERIYFVVAQIPKGKVATYKDVAKAAFVKNPRVVGFALHANKRPQTVPCHRVTMATGVLAKGYAFGGAKKQREKLQEEGVPFLDNNQVNLAICLAKLVPYKIPSKHSAIRQQGVNL